MGNSLPSPGVYSHMLRAPLFLLCSLAAVPQQWAQPWPGQDPMDAAIQAAWQARGDTQRGEVAAAREHARALLQRVPVDSPGFGSWAQQLAQLYQNSQFNAQARAVLRGAEARTAGLGDSHPSHIAVLNALAEYSRQDGNLLQAVGYMEQAAAAQAAAPPLAARQLALRGIAISGRHRGYFGGGNDLVYAYVRLAEGYQQIGRPDAANAIAGKVRNLLAHDLPALAGFLEQQGQLEEAGAIYKKLAGQAADPQTEANAWQSLANLDARQERYTDSVEAMQRAIAALQSSGNPDIRAQAVWMRQNLAVYLRQAGFSSQADQIFQQLIQEARDESQKGQVLGMYAQHLLDSERGAQAESLLNSYLADNPDLDPMQKMNLLFHLANVAQRAGDAKRAAEYQKAGQALQPQLPVISQGQTLIGEDVQKALAAANEHHLDEAYNLTLHAIDAAAFAADGQQVEWTVPQIAQILANEKEPAKAEQIFTRMLALAQDWSADSMGPLISGTENYVRFLINQPERQDEAAAAIERLRGVLTDAKGPESGSLAEPVRMKIQLATVRSEWPRAEASARELLELEESLSGNTSQPYLDALQTVARAFDAADRPLQALPLRRQTVAIADLLATPDNGWLRSGTRMELALALANLGQFEEAERLAAEAVSLAGATRVPTQPLAQQLTQILQMKQAAAAAVASRGGR